jgi:hypothetical protein
MLKAIRQYVCEFIADESGQATNDWMHTLAFSALTFVLIIAFIMVCQNAFVKVLADVMCRQMHQMASGAARTY